MRDAWIYATTRADSSEHALALAELGFSPRHVNGGDVVPRLEQGARLRQPSLAVVVGALGEPAPTDVCARLRDEETTRDVPVLLSLPPEALSASTDVLYSHELIVRPFTAEELRVRIARLQRERNGGPVDAQVVRVGSLALDLDTYQVTVDGEVVGFAFMEYELLRFLVTHPGKVFTREALLRRVWGYEYYGGARTVDVHVRRVRAKIGSEHAARISTVRGVGYRFDAA